MIVNIYPSAFVMVFRNISSINLKRPRRRELTYPEHTLFLYTFVNSTKELTKLLKK